MRGVVVKVLAEKYISNTAPYRMLCIGFTVYYISSHLSDAIFLCELWLATIHTYCSIGGPIIAAHPDIGTFADPLARQMPTIVILSSDNQYYCSYYSTPILNCIFKLMSWPIPVSLSSFKLHALCSS